jgi:hypothetical protein
MIFFCKNNNKPEQYRRFFIAAVAAFPGNAGMSYCLLRDF